VPDPRTVGTRSTNEPVGARRTARGARRLLPALALALGLFMAVGVEARTLPEAMPGDRIVYVEYVDELDEGSRGVLVSVTPDGTDRRRLAEAPEGWDIHGPRWAPDGQTIFHNEQYLDSSGTLIDADGGNRRGLSWECVRASWKPDGRELVCAVDDAGGPGLETGTLRVYRTDGTKVRDIPNTPAGVGPQWSPDGGLIAYIAIGAQPELYVIRPDGSGKQLIARNTSRFEWSPDGRQLLFFRDGGWRLVDRDGSNVRVLGHEAGSWSPDGGWFAFTRRDTQTERDEVWVIRVDGTDARRVSGAPEQDHRGPVWSASGERLAFTVSSGQPEDSPRPSDVWVVDVHTPGAAPVRLTDSGRAYSPAFAPGLAFRVLGTDRIGTAVDVSSRMRDAATTAVIARADDYADALAGGPLAAAADAPLLLTGRDRLHPATASEVRRLGVSRAYLLGSTAALPGRVAEDLHAAGVTVTRLGGANRFHTAALIATELVRITGPVDTAYIVEGGNRDPRRGWPDAVAAGGLAATETRPILPVLRDTLPRDTAAAIKDLDLDRAVIVGGPTAVSPEVADAVAAHEVTVERIAGETRYDTAARVAERAIAAGASAQRPWIATGRNWPDALAVGPAATADGGVLVLIDGADPNRSPATTTWLDTHCCYHRLTLAGGPAAINPTTATHVEARARP
jgi:putative cell wall-binding protein/Tol biopolymer transport system component